MKICIAQTQSLKGKVKENIQNHLQIINNGIDLNADLILFPELSITGFEPKLAKKLTTNVEDAIFNPFQVLANKNEITIGIGMPTKAIDGINISMLIFQPNRPRTVYSKQLLHSDELAYFSCGKQDVLLHIKEKKIAVGICYETLQRNHFLKAIQNNADFYIASVAKSKGGIQKAYSHFSKIAEEFKTPILLSNGVGYCDNFISAGQSAVWNKNGKLIAQLDGENQGILIFDTKSDIVEIFQFT